MTLEKIVGWRRLGRFLLIGLTACLILVPARVSSSRDEPNAAEIVLKKPVRAGHLGEVENQKVRLARDLIRQRNYTGASALLETVYEKFPTHPTVYTLLKSCYAKLKLDYKEEQITRRMVAQFPNNYSFRMNLGQVLARQEKMDAARAQFDSAVAIIPDASRHSFRNVVKSMMSTGLYPEAVNLIADLRLRLDDSLFMGLEKGMLLERQKRYSEAVAELFTVLNDTTNIAISAERRIVALLEFPESSAAVEATLLERNKFDANQRSLKLLTNYYLKTEQFNKAFAFAAKQDSLDDSNGSSLLYFMRACQERDRSEWVVEMARYVLNDKRPASLLIQTRLMLAQGLTEIKKYDSAIEVYSQLHDESPRVREQADLLFRIGSVYQQHLNDCRKALTYYDSLMVHFPAGAGHTQARLASAGCFVRLGELETARKKFEQLRKFRLNQDVTETVDFSLAQIAFYQKQIDSSLARFRKLIVDYPNGYYFNDAMQLLMTADRVGGSAEQLYDYSNVLLFYERQLFDSALASLEKMTSSTLADLALFQIVELQLELENVPAALTGVGRLEEEHPESYYLPFALKLKADILFENDSTANEADSIYKRLLTDHPNYPFGAEIRKKLRETSPEEPIG